MTIHETYRVTLTHDHGRTTFELPATSARSAAERVCALEHAPLRAVKRVTCGGRTVDHRARWADPTDQEPNRTVTVRGRHYRVCVYATTGGWAGFAESSRYYVGGTGEHASRRRAVLAAVRLVALDAASVTA